MSKDELTHTGIHNKAVKQAQVYACETGAQNPRNQISNDLQATARDSRLAGNILVPAKMSKLFNGHHKG